ncbi:type IV pilin protein [Pelagibaculum spongiae]|uniref:Pilus assembly protein PilE n=1 Tax=Pelagibaculum spongiae TaxID=2080658 RepID=A0A2V1H3L5_9GAMM|nr:type IV pilin protein [Pelagibaculum spongiae]PVZ72560.1 pilus assembly protein PilE [Pelagibaculum spongiae]
MKKNGFTLIELMIVVAVVGILASIAWPSYQQSLRKSYRKEAVSILSIVAQKQEARLLKQQSYTDDITALHNAIRPVDTALPNGPKEGISPSGQHKITVSTNATATTNATEYTITATPANGDAECGALTYNYLGVKTAAAGTVDLCW